MGSIARTQAGPQASFLPRPRMVPGAAPCPASPPCARDAGPGPLARCQLLTRLARAVAWLMLTWQSMSVSVTAELAPLVAAQLAPRRCKDARGVFRAALRLPGDADARRAKAQPSTRNGGAATHGR